MISLSLIFSMALQPFVGIGRVFSYLIYIQSVGLLGRVISPSQGLYLYTEQHKHSINAYTNIHTSSRFRTYDPSVPASEDSSCLRPLGYRDRPLSLIAPTYITSIHIETVHFGTYNLES
jgi:hypothetical protein